MRDRLWLSPALRRAWQAVAEAALAAGAFVALPGRESKSRSRTGTLLVLGGVDLTDFRGG